MKSNSKKILCLSLAFSLIFQVSGFAAPTTASPNEPTLVVKTISDLTALPSKTATGNLTVLIEDGTYSLNSPIDLTGNNVTLKSKSGVPGAVVLTGNFKIDHLISIAGADTTLQDLTLCQSSGNGVVIQGDKNADRPILKNLRITDIVEAQVKATSSDTDSSEGGTIEGCVFENKDSKTKTPSARAIDLSKSVRWTIKNNIVKTITSLTGKMSFGAIVFNNTAQGIRMDANQIVRCDRGIQLSGDGSAITGAVITNNTIHTQKDVGISLWNFDDVKVLNNTIYAEGNWVNGLEYRSARTQNNTLLNNLTTGPIVRKSGSGLYADYNVTTAAIDWFVAPSEGNLHLKTANRMIVNKGKTDGTVLTDMDGTPRATGKYDIGADEIDDSTIKTPAKVLLTVDKTAIFGNNVDTAKMTAIGTFGDGTTAAVTPDSFVCYDSGGNPLSVSSLNFHTYRPGVYTVQALVGDIQSNPITLTVKSVTLTQLQVSSLKTIHWMGQTFITWEEINPVVSADVLSGKTLHSAKLAIGKKIQYRIYRSSTPITTVQGLAPIAQVDPLSGWDAFQYGVNTGTSDNPINRFVIPNRSTPLPVGTGLYVFTPGYDTTAYYAVTAVVDGKENRWLSYANCLQAPIAESYGAGVPILQRVTYPDTFLYVNNPTVYYYTRWEAPPNANVNSQATNYLVAVPPKSVEKAALGIHLHCWGGTEESGYGWWTNAESGSILLASNLETPYDWWTGHHEQVAANKTPKTQAQWQQGTVHPYSTNRLFNFVDWMKSQPQWDIDYKKTFIAGASMGGSGSIMAAIRYGEKFAFCRSWVGVHIPEESGQFEAYQLVYGPPSYGTLFENGLRVWDYYNDDWFLRQYPKQDTPFITFSNGKNDTLIGWPQAVKFLKALQDTKRPHLFVWGQNGHNERALMPYNLSEKEMPLALRTDQSQPAFTRCSLDDNPGNGTPEDGAPAGQINGYLYWETDSIVDTLSSWEMTVALAPASPKDKCTVDITPRRCQQFRVSPGATVQWSNKDVVKDTILEKGTVQADDNGLVTIPQITVTKGKNRIILKLL